MSVLVTLVLIGSTVADVIQTNPSPGSCLCVTSEVNVRETACGMATASISRGQCFKYRGLAKTCVKDGVTYELFGIDGGSVGWVAGKYLNVGSASQCQSNAGGCPRIVSRAEWEARTPRSKTPLKKPVPRVFIHHTETGSCTSQLQCTRIVKSIQNYHMDKQRWSDIGYNFLVGEDGNAYEGRGWDVVGSHITLYNRVSIGISVIGNFTSRLPNAAALNTVKQLIDCGLSKNKLPGTYKLHGHRDGGCTDCPGQSLYDLIRTWPNYGGKLPGSCQDVTDMKWIVV